MTTFGEKLRYLRKKRDLTQEQLGDILKLGKSTISQYESNTNTPDISIIKQIAKTFNVSVDWLVDDTDEAVSEAASNQIKEAIGDDPELLEFWNDLTTRDDLLLMFKQARKLPPDEVKKIIRIIKAIEDEEANEEY